MLFVPHVNLALVVIVVLTKNNNLGEHTFDWYVQLYYPCSKLYLDIYKVPSTCFMQLQLGDWSKSFYDIL
jgi:hypothetical protein